MVFSFIFCVIHKKKKVSATLPTAETSAVLTKEAEEIHSRVIVILPIWVSLALGGGAGGWGVSGVISYSLYEFRNVQR